MAWLFDLLVLLVSWAVVVQQIWATRGHFVSAKMASGAMLLAALVIVSTLVYSVLLWVSHQPLWAMLVGVLLELASQALFWGAILASRRAALLFAFDPGMPGSIVRHGPYRYVRHPFYASYVLFWIGWAVATWSLWALPFLLGIVVLYVVAARGEEQKFANTPMAADYERYKSSAGFFWPRFAGR